uniref:Si:ch73-22o12.1 n=1 Tax=Xiphophorus couchianus TaxID=32473 RepID=A0A3B5MW92_9TELE
MTVANVFLSLLFHAGTSGQRVKVEPELASYPGQTVNLRCVCSSSLLLYADLKRAPLQVTWIYEPKDGERMNIAVFHPNFGPNYPESQMKGRVTFKPSPPELSSPSIEISNVRMTDEGRYVCEYATYPDGNEQGITQLVMLAKPLNSATAVTVNAGTQPVVVARCESKDGRPAAKIQWLTTAKGNWTETSQTGTDNTVTVTSEYRLAPTAMDNAKDLTCLVTHRTQLKDESLPLKLAIQYPPVVEIEGYDNNWYVGRTNVGLLCKANANPIPLSVDWKTMTGEMPDTVQIKENELKVLKVDSSVNTTFVCEVKNSIGATREQVTINVREPSKTESNAGVVAGAVIGSLLALLLVAALVTVLVTRSRRQQQGYRANGGSDMKTRIFGGGKKPFTVGARPEVVTGTPTAQDILLSNELDEAERRKFDEMEEDERYDHFAGGGSILQLRPPPNPDDIIGDYMDDDMESQRDGSVISRTAVYV